MERETLTRLADELQEQWAGAFVQQAWQDVLGRVVLRLYRPGAGDAFLLLSPLPGAQGLGLLAHRPAVPPRPPALAAWLRAHLVGGRLEAVACAPTDRLVELCFGTRAGPLRVVLEAVGRRGNLAAMDAEGLVRAAWRWEPAERHPLRPLVPGAPYAAPPAPPGPPQEHPAAPGAPEDLRAAGARLEALAAGEVRGVEESEAEALRRKAVRRLEGRAEKIRGDLARLPDAAALRRVADALAAGLGAVGRGQACVRLPDPYGEGAEVEVPLDPRLGPGENLNRLYEKARKVERGRRALEARLAATLAEAEAAGAGPPAAAPPAREPGDAGPYRRLRASNGWPLWVGRNGKENDRLVKEALPWDLWFHAKDAAGAHVLLRLPGREARVPEAVVLEAAALAARHSRAAAEAAADVLVAEAGRVRKPKGASPGKVLVSGERVVRVRPSEPQS